MRLFFTQLALLAVSYIVSEQKQIAIMQMRNRLCEFLIATRNKLLRNEDSMNNRLKQQLDFALEIDKEKIFSDRPPVGTRKK